MSSVLHAQQKKLEDYVEMKKDGGFAPIKERKEPNRLAPLVPRSLEYWESGPTLHGVPALCICLRESCLASVYGSDETDAAGDGFR